MYHFILRSLFFVSVSLLLHACAASQKFTQDSTNIKSLNYLGSYEIPFNYKYNNTIVGGLSGIDYDAKHDLFYLISDDRSEKNTARFYTAKILISKKEIDSFSFTGQYNLLQPGGNVYPGVNQDRFNTPDPEAIRYNAHTGQLIWSSEGERFVRGQDTVLVNPAIHVISTSGTYLESYNLPDNLKMNAAEKGPRKNGVLEGISFADNFKTVFTSVEEPLYEDGPQADIVDNNTYIRILKFNISNKQCTAQYAYKLEPVAYPAIPENEFKVNGVSEILSLGNNKLLVMERSFSTGRLPSTIRLFIADLNEASDISLMQLKDNQQFVPAKKTLLLNMDDLGIYTDNIEGVSFGPKLPNGNRTLIFIADNNFNFFKKAQVLLFEITE